MFGGSGKAGRGGGGGRGGGKRNINSNFHPSSINRQSGGRLPVGGAPGPRNHRNTTSGSTSSAPSSAVEETFSLVTGNPLNFAMIIRLAPDLVDEIKRAESQGGSARMKFDANANHPSGNVIDVGGKTFRFTWSREMGDLCDIYEERRSGEHGNGLLVESGCAWRKLNVPRVLDESAKKHVKMRSEEAEKKLKSRKAIVLDHGNPSMKNQMKNQMKALAAAEVNTWRMPFNQKKEPPYKKRKAEPSPGPPKSLPKYGASLTTPSKGRTSASSLPSTPEQPGAPASPFVHGSLSKGHVSVEDIMSSQAMSKEKATSSEKGTPTRVITAAVRDKQGCKGDLVNKSTDLQSLLISLLTENSKGMSLKALEKAVGDTIPNSARQIEPIIRRIATLQAPGRYFLKQGVELESFKKPPSESGSSPENNQRQTPAPVDICDQVPDPEPSLSVKTHNKEFDEKTQIYSKPADESIAVEKIDILLHSPDPNGENKVTDNSKGPVETSSDSGSDSDSESDSSDSESDSGSHSRSKSRSPVGSGSGSSSDSDSDASSNSKEGSDEDVDIMTSDDDKEPKNKLQASEPGFTSPISWRTNGPYLHNVIDEKQDVHGSKVVEISKNSPGHDQRVEMAEVTNSVPSKESGKPAEEAKSSLADSRDQQERRAFTGKLCSERENMAKEAFVHGQSDNSDRKSKGKSKRRSDGKNFDDNAERAKKVKAGDLTRAQIPMGSNLFSGSPRNLSPGRPIDGPYRGLTTQTMDGTVRDRTDFGLHRGYNQEIPGKCMSDSQQSGPRPVDHSWAKAPAIDRPGKHADNLSSSIKHTERNLQMHEDLPMQKEKFSVDTQGKDAFNNEKMPPKNSKEVGVLDKHSTPVDSHNRKRGELVGKFKEVGSISNLHAGYSPKNNNTLDRSPMMNGRGAMLRREPSDLELGELREPLHEEAPGVKKQLEKKGSFKQSENKPTTSDYWNSDFSKGKPDWRTSRESVKPSPPNSNVGILSNTEGLFRKRTPEHNVDDSMKPKHRVVQPQPPLQSRVDEAEVGSQVSKLADVNSKSRYREPGTSQGIGLEGYGDTHRKVPVNPQQHDVKQGLVLHSTKESRRKKSNTLSDFSDRRQDPSSMDSHDGGRKRRESSSEENGCSYFKYEKEKPEIKGPIKNHSQYTEYVQEYCEKYDSYSSINKILESERNDFDKLGRELEIAKGRDMDKYHSIVAQLNESFRCCGTRHKRLKKIFIVLHEELKHLKEMIKDYADSCPKD